MKWPTFSLLDHCIVRSNPKASVLSIGMVEMLEYSIIIKESEGCSGRISQKLWWNFKLLVLTNLLRSSPSLWDSKRNYVHNYHMCLCYRDQKSLVFYGSLEDGMNGSWSISAEHHVLKGMVIHLACWQQNNLLEPITSSKTSDRFSDASVITPTTLYTVITPRK